MSWELGEEARARGVGLLALDEVDSTNEEGKRLAASGEGGPLWVVARRQTRGRGRLGRSWISSEGNLHASLVYSEGVEPSKAPQLGFVAGLAAVAALRGLTELGKRIALKWPNDLLLDGAKLGGVLLEGASIPTGDLRWSSQLVTIIGVGVNCVSAPENLPYPAQALQAVEPQAPSAEALFKSLSEKFVAFLDLWAGGEGFGAIREMWLEDAAGVGGEIRIGGARGESLRGRFKTIDASGRLILETKDGQCVIDAGDVFLGQAGCSQSSGGIS